MSVPLDNSMVFIPLQHGQQLYRHIYLGCKEESSGQQHYENLYALLGLLSVELANEEVVVDLIRLALALQVRRLVCVKLTILKRRMRCMYCMFICFSILKTDFKKQTVLFSFYTSKVFNELHLK